jgi:hypothetical protein
MKPVNEEKTQIPDYFPSMHAAAAFFGMPEQVLRWAKKQGCQAFTQAGRLRTLPLLKFLLAARDGQADDTDTDWGNRLRQYQAERELIKLNKERGEIMDKREVKTGLIKAVAILESTIDRMVTVELAAECRGREASDIQRILTAAKEKWKLQWKSDLARISAGPDETPNGNG